jgi:hypothetical protein
MPIAILDLPEPFTFAAHLQAELPPLIESDAYRQLVHELRRYCNGEVSGRSFLIAGHRGSGKTTLVSSAFEALLREDLRVMRPLLVVLQGPTLLPGTKEELPLAMDGTGEANRRLTEMENVLVQITLGLHRALARTAIIAYREHVERAAHNPGELRDLLELAAELQLELDQYSGKARLREIWRRGQALPEGVLFRDSSRNPFTSFGTPLRPDDQGFRELVGLSSVCEAYRRISGKISRKDESKAGASEKAERSFEVDAKGKDLTTPLIAALTGGAVGAGTLVANQKPAVAALAGVVTALGAMVAGKISFSRTRQRSASLEDLFIPDLSVATLDRILPVLIDRLRDAGIAPVFVIDELDKVDALSTRIQDMIQRLKKLVAENACFCFLADRRYFEEMRQRTVRTPYSLEYTYFTHQIFVTFRHTDMRAYLENKILRKPMPVDGQDRDAARRVAEEQADYEVLPRILMHGAQMHPIDLLRQLSHLRSVDGTVALEPGALRTRRRYLLELMLQLGIEMQLEQEAMQEELDRRPAFRRLAHDAVYFVSREWEKDEEQLVLKDDARKAFETYLIGRMALDGAHAPAAPMPAPAAAPLPAEPAPAPASEAPKPPDVPLISVEDLSFLWRTVQALAKVLAMPQTLQHHYQEKGLSTVVLDAVSSAVGLGPLLEEIHEQPGVYRWRFRRSGRQVVAVVGPPETAALEPLWTPHIRAIRDFESALRVATDGAVDPSTLSSMLGILPTSPAWPSVATAVSRLETMAERKMDHPEKEEDIAAVGAFFEILQQNAAAVATAVFCAHVLSAWSQVARDRVLDAMEKMSAVLGLRALRPEQVVERITSLHDALVPHLDPTVVKRPVGDAAAWIEWMNGLKQGVKLRDGVKQEMVDTAVKTAWEQWRTRLQGGTPPPTADLHMLICAINGTGPAVVLKLPIESMTLRDWSWAFYLAVTREPAPDKRTPPSWLALAALQELGWGERLSALTQRGQRVDLPLFGEVQPPSDEVRSIQDWKMPATAPRGGPAALIATQAATPDKAPLSEGWLRATSYAALVLRVDELANLQKLWHEQREDLLPRLGYELMALDASAGKQLTKSAPRHRRFAESEAALPLDDFKSILNFYRPAGKTQIPVIVAEEFRGEVPPDHRLVIKPKSLEDLFAGVIPKPHATPAGSRSPTGA